MVTAGSFRCGFFMDTDKEYLGLNPDAIVTLANEDKGFIEIKCPPTFRDKTVHECMRDARYPLVCMSRQSRIKVVGAFVRNSREIMPIGIRCSFTYTAAERSLHSVTL